MIIVCCVDIDVGVHAGQCRSLTAYFEQCALIQDLFMRSVSTPFACSCSSANVLSLQRAAGGAASRSCGHQHQGEQATTEARR